MPIRKDTAERMARQFLRTLYPQGHYEIREVKYVDSPFEYTVIGRVDIRNDWAGRRLWANFEILVNPKAEEILDYKIDKYPGAVAGEEGKGWPEKTRPKP